jgi:hypothetical protein
MMVLDRGNFGCRVWGYHTNPLQTMMDLERFTWEENNLDPHRSKDIHIFADLVETCILCQS